VGPGHPIRHGAFEVSCSPVSESVAQPPVDGDLADAEEPFGVGDGDHDGILAAGCDSFQRRLKAGMPRRPAAF
jgi:hypothetical protein